MISKYRKALLWITCGSILVSCSTSQRGLFGKKTPHEKYHGSLKDAGLINTRLGKLWLLAADKSLTNPVQVTIPYKETGYFEMDDPAAAGYIFSAKRGEQLNIAVSTNPANGFLLFVELWEPVINEKPGLLSAADTVLKNITYEIKKDGNYIVRMQPELLQGTAYTITINTSASLAFPVNKNDNPRVISFWGAGRDAGARSHEGIDIQARKLTPAIASSDGYITSVSENNLGGKVVFLRPKGKNYNLYYAHLDEQLVSSGQSVNTGDTIGLIGNTGNARYTAAHLHFGIYTSGGAIDPLPFININRAAAKEVKADTGFVTKHVRVKNNTSLYKAIADKPQQQTPITAGSIAKVIAAADDFYKIKLPDNTEGFIKSAAVTDQPLRRQSLPALVMLLDMPDGNAAVKMNFESGNAVTLLGTYKDYYFAEWQNNYGWIKK